jgi:hypothetical protein
VSTDPPPDPLGATDVSDPRGEARSAYLQVLQAFAAEAPEGELTATTYARARERHREWPTRNTIAAAFGGWARALDAAGLGSRASGRARATRLPSGQRIDVPLGRASASR